MHPFDYRFLADSLPANILEITGIIYDLRGRGEIRKNDHPQVFRELRHTAMIDSVQSSNAIEGIVTTAERMKALVSRQAEPYSHDEQEILGYRDALNEIFTGYQDMEISDCLLTPDSTSSRITGSRSVTIRDELPSGLHRSGPRKRRTPWSS